MKAYGFNVQAFLDRYDAMVGYFLLDFESYTKSERERRRMQLRGYLIGGSYAVADQEFYDLVEFLIDTLMYLGDR